MEQMTAKHASSVMKKLRQQGCIVLEALKAPRRIIINIENPTPVMAGRATAIKQCLNGVQSTVCVLQVEGCTVSWNKETSNV